MYPSDPESKVVKLESVPQCDVGSPSPQIFAHERGMVVAYLTQRLVPAEDLTLPCRYAVVRFVQPLKHMFGWPNDEAINGHPLYKKGLKAYGAFHVLNSPWAKQLEEMNSVHPGHGAGAYLKMPHYILTFHDSTLECIARSFEVQLVDSMQAVTEAFRKEFDPSW